MTVIYNLTQHVATPEQVSAGVVDLPAEDRKILVDLLTVGELPDFVDLRRRVRGIVALLPEISPEKGDSLGTAMIGGAPFLMGLLAQHLDERGYNPVFAFSKRVVEERAGEDGTVTKVAVFRHEGFVKDYSV